MSARFSWSPEDSYAFVTCHVYPDRPPILDTSVSGVSLTISAGAAEAVSAEHVEFARLFAEAAGVYAEECAQWVGGQRVGGSAAAS